MERHYDVIPHPNGLGFIAIEEENGKRTWTSQNHPDRESCFDLIESRKSSRKSIQSLSVKQVNWYPDKLVREGQQVLTKRIANARKKYLVTFSRYLTKRQSQPEDTRLQQFTVSQIREITGMPLTAIRQLAANQTLKAVQTHKRGRSKISFYSWESLQNHMNQLQEQQNGTQNS